MINQYRTHFLLFVILLFCSNAYLFAAGKQKITTHSDNVVIQKIYDAWNARDAKTESFLIEFDVQTTIFKDSLRSPGRGRNNTFGKIIPKKDQVTESSTIYAFDHGRLSVDAQEEIWDIELNQLISRRRQGSYDLNESRSYMPNKYEGEYGLAKITFIKNKPAPEWNSLEYLSTDLAYRPIVVLNHLELDYSNAKLISENAMLGNEQYIQIEIPKSPPKKSIFLLWVSRSPDHRIKQFQWFMHGNLVVDTLLHYSKENEQEDSLIGWELTYSGSYEQDKPFRPKYTTEATIKNSSINTKLPESLFKLKFPPHTLVRQNIITEAGRKQEHKEFFILKNGHHTGPEETEKLFQECSKGIELRFTILFDHFELADPRLRFWLRFLRISERVSGN
jgi:hypothetical protein